MINLNKQEELDTLTSLTPEQFYFWLKGFITYANRNYGQHTLPAYSSNDMLNFLNSSPDNSAGLIFWLRGYLQLIPDIELSEFKGYKYILTYLETFE